MSEYAPVIDLSTLDGTNGFRLAGTIPISEIGAAVAGAGDFNHDGIGDLLIAGYGPTGGVAAGPGVAYVVYGSADGFAASIDLATMPSDQGIALAGVDVSDFTGNRVAAAGDINGDGAGDILISASHADPDGQTDAGAVYVVFGAATGAAPSLDGLDGSNGFRIDGVAGALLGSCGSAGDINGDGFGDVVVGSYAENGSAGAAYVIYGSAAGFAPSMDVADIDGENGFRIGGQSNDSVGSWATTAGDVNGDGFDDLMVTAGGADVDGKIDAGKTFIIYGDTAGFDADFDTATLDGSNGFAIEGAVAGDFSGTMANGLGDINGDGVADMAVSAYSADPGGRSDAGSTWVLFGQAEGFSATVDLGSLDGTNGFRMDGLNPGDWLGSFAISSAGDMNADGFGDLLVTSYGADGNSGSTYVVFGKAGGFDLNFDLTTLDGDNGFVINGSGFERSGFSASSAGDINADGLDDLIIGAPGQNGDRGAAYVYYGALPSEAVSRFGSLIGQTIHGGDFNDALHGMGGGDRLIGHGGGDLLDGGNGADTLAGGLGDDTLSGGSGKDTASYADAGGAVRVDLSITAGQNTFGAGVDTLGRIENLQGSAFADTLTGDGGGNLLDGGDGKDRLLGGVGGDTLLGGAGPDKLTGGAGADDMTGGFGPDIFVFKALADSTVKHADLITDLGSDDRIDLHAIDADTTRDGNQAFHLVAALTGHAGQATLQFNAGGGETNLSLDVDGDGEADMVVRISGDHHDFTGFML